MFIIYPIQISVEARDNGNPARYGYAVCTASGLKNLYAPRFADDYQQTITVCGSADVNFRVGETVVTVNAVDQDIQVHVLSLGC